METQKGKKWRTSKQEFGPQGKESWRRKRFPSTGKLPHKGAQGGVVDLGQNKGPGVQKIESCTSQPINSSWIMAPTRRQAQGTKGSPQEAPGAEASQGARRCAEFRRGIQSTQNVQCRGQVQRTETGEHKLRNTEGRPEELRQVKQVPQYRGQAQWAQASAHMPRHTEGKLRGWGKLTRASMMQRAGPGSWEKIHTSPYLATFGLQCRAGPGDRSTGRDSRDKQGNGGSEDILIRSLWRDCRNRYV